MSKNTENVLRPSQIRIARPTSDLIAAQAFYCDVLGGQRLFSFQDHAGFSGVMIGFPDAAFHLELVLSPEKSLRPSPTEEDALVLYLPDSRMYAATLERFRTAGIDPIQPMNPYWRAISTCFLDPDGYTVIIAKTGGLRA